MSDTEIDSGALGDLFDRVEQLETEVERIEEDRVREPDPLERSPDGDSEQRTRIKTIKQVIELADEHNDQGAPLQDIYSIAVILGIESDEVSDEIEKLRRQGEIYEPTPDVVRVT
jgi:replicative DNA helicase Mcm